MGQKKKLAKGRLDKFYYMAKEQGYRARAAFKLIQLNKKYNFLNNARAILDLCAAPGSWLQVCSKYCPASCVMVGVDLDPIRPIRNCKTIVADITTSKCRTEVKKALEDNQVDVVLHDGAPNVGTAWTQDAFSQSQLVLSSLKLGTEFLRSGGVFVTKIFRSADYNSLLWVFNQLFKKVEATKPQASRNTSAEIFVVCQGYLAPARLDPRLLDPKHVFKEMDMPAKVIDVFHDKQKRNREGYEDGVTLLYKHCPVRNFIETDNPIPMLGQYNEFIFDEESLKYKSHPKTSQEILALCKDLKVLSKGDFKLLLKWRLEMLPLREKSQEEEEKGEEEEENDTNEQEEITSEQEEENLQTELEQRILDIKKKKTRTQKKLIQKRKKIQRKIDLKMIIPDDQLDEQRDEELFELRKLKGNDQLTQFTSMTSPDIVIEEDEEDEEEEELQKIRAEEEREFEGLDEDETYQKLMEKYLDQMYDQFLERKNRKAEREAEKAASSKAAIRGILHDDLSLDELPGAKRQKIATGFIPRVTGNIFEDEEDNPLIVKETQPQISSSKRALAWFGQDDFENIDEEEDEMADLEWLKNEMKRKKEEKKKKQNHKEEDEQEENMEIEEEEDDGREEIIEASSGEEEEEEELIRTQPKPTKLKNKLDRSESEEEEGYSDESDFEEVPIDEPDSDLEDVDSKAKVLALGTMLVNKKKFRSEMEDAAFNRYTWNDDEGLPQWFQDEEKPSLTPQLPITKAMVQAMKQRFKELDARPIKKVAEAKARKKLKLMRKMEKVKKKVEEITDAPEMSTKEKAHAIAKVYKSQKSKGKVKTVLMVAKKGGGRKAAKNAPSKEKGVKTKVKSVDARLKKDVRAQKSAEKRKHSRKRKRK